MTNNRKILWSGAPIFWILQISWLPYLATEHSACKTGTKILLSEECQRYYQECINGAFITNLCPINHRFDLSLEKCVSCEGRVTDQRPKRQTLPKYYRTEKFEENGLPKSNIYYYNPNGLSFRMTILGWNLPVPLNKMTEWIEKTHHEYPHSFIDYVNPLNETTMSSSTPSAVAEVEKDVQKDVVKLNKTWRDILPITQCGIFGGNSFDGKSANKISNGNITQIEKNPWQVGIINLQTGLIWCGGSIISSKLVLTARHCFLTLSKPAKNILKSNLVIHAGATNYLESKHIFNISQVFYHSQFSNTHRRNDITMVVIKGIFTWSSSIYPICLPKKEDEDLYTPGRVGIVSGWGNKVFHHPDNNPFLFSANLKISTYEECREGKNEKITQGMFCATDILKDGRVVDTCSGDSGGPLVSYSTLTNRYVLLGITSFGRSCALKNSPGVYTKVNQYLRWIYDRVEVSEGVGYGSRFNLPADIDVGKP